MLESAKDELKKARKSLKQKQSDSDDDDNNDDADNDDENKQNDDEENSQTSKKLQIILGLHVVKCFICGNEQTLFV
jgi:hypothetical protein